MAPDPEHEFITPMLDRIEKIVHAEVGRLESFITTVVSQVRSEMAAESRRVDEQMDLRAKHQAEMSLAEAKRIDSNREGDMKAVALANDRANTAAEVLRASGATQAETLRGLVATTATAVAQQLSQITEQMTTRLLALENARFESRGSSGSMEKALGWIFGVVMAMTAIGAFIFTNLKK
jgi:uncharacterized membrane protein YqiK